jgi:hypothetical protein
MGSEALVVVRFKGKRVAGKARLETDVLQFRADDLRLSIRFREITKITVRDGTLSVNFPDGCAGFDLGRDAARWAEKIQHPPSRLDKIGAKPDWHASAIGVDDEGFLAELENAIARLSIGRVVKQSDAIFFGVNKEVELGRLEKLRESLKPNGAIWIIRPKGRPEISERATMAAAKRAGLVDVKVVGFSATHTAEKFVIPLHARPQL